MQELVTSESRGQMIVATVVGARPQFVKASMVSRALRACGVNELLIHTGQHYDENMSDVFFRALDIPRPSVNLGIGSGTHGAQTGRMLEQIESVLLANRPDMLVVYGDTNSTLAGALAAAKLQITIAHVEAGLRSFDKRVPEEINRIVTDHVSDLLLAPTKAAVGNLMNEGVPETKIFEVGDVMYDTALHYGAKAERESSILSKLGLRRGEFVLATIHRAENTDNEDRLESVFRGLAEAGKGIPIVLPLHPRTKASLSNKGILSSLAESIRIIGPVGYLDMMMLEKSARLIVTDSGGVQKEAFFYGVPCLTLRNQTEWSELVELGWNRVTPPVSARRVAEAIRSALAWTPRPCSNPFGDGHAAEKIASIIQDSVTFDPTKALVSVDR
jgi:UDP-GlcNAc3NAcA epimerase